MHLISAGIFVVPIIIAHKNIDQNVMFMDLQRDSRVLNYIIGGLPHDIPHDHYIC